MKQIVIRNYLSGSHLLESEPQTWDAIIILDSKLTPSDFAARHARRLLLLRFDDVSSDSFDKRAPSVGDVEAALDFAAVSQNLLVCCRAGQSRSAAMAFLIGFQQLGPEAACRLLNPQRHIPNSLILELGALVLGDEVSRIYAQWRDTNKDVRLSDHLEDIEREFDELEARGVRNRIIETRRV